MKLKDVKLVWNTLCEAQAANTGSGHWLPEAFAEDLAKCIKIMKTEMRAAQQREALDTLIGDRIKA